VYFMAMWKLLRYSDIGKEVVKIKGFLNKSLIELADSHCHNYMIFPDSIIGI